MKSPAPTLLDSLADLVDEAYAHWDSGMKAGKILTALAGHIQNYDPRITAIRDALASPSSGRLTAADLERATEAAWNSRGVACKWQWLTAKQRDFYVRQQRAAFAAIGLPIEGEQG